MRSVVPDRPFPKFAAECSAPRGEGPGVLRRVRQGLFPLGDERYRGVVLQGMMPMEEAVSQRLEEA